MSFKRYKIWTEDEWCVHKPSGPHANCISCLDAYMRDFEYVLECREHQYSDLYFFHTAESISLKQLKAYALETFFASPDLDSAEVYIDAKADVDITSKQIAKIEAAITEMLSPLLTQYVSCYRMVDIVDDESVPTTLVSELNACVENLPDILAALFAIRFKEIMQGELT